MTVPSQADILKKAWERASNDTEFAGLMAGRVHNYVPQESPLPFARVRWGQSMEWDQKDSDGCQGYITIDIFTDYRGDRKALQAADRAIEIFHNNPLALEGAQSLILRRDFVDAFTEPDGITHHTVVRFLHVATETEEAITYFYLRPDGSEYLRPDGITAYARPA